MITIEDSLKLAFLKFKSRKIHSILSMVIFSLGVITIMIFLLGAASIRDILWNAYPDRYGTHFAAIKWEIDVDEEKNENNDKGEIDGVTDNTVNINVEKDKAIPSISEFRSLYQKRYDIKDVYTKVALANVAVVFKEYEGKSLFRDDRPRSLDEYLDLGGGHFLIPHNIMFIDPYLSKESVFDGYSLENKYGGKIPLIVPSHYAIEALVNRLNSGSTNTNKRSDDDFWNMVFVSPQEEMEQQRKLQEYIGKEVTVGVYLDESESDKSEIMSFEGVIVGYTDTTSMMIPDRFQLGYGRTGLIIPEWAKSVNEGIGKLYNQEIKQNAEISYVVEFDSIEKRSKFVEAVGDAKYRQKLSLINSNYDVITLFTVQEALQQVLDVLLSIVICLASVFLTVGMAFVTINVLKILADSRKEIGIFRAVGAQQSDIVKIFMSYVFLILTGGFLISLIVAVSINISLSLFFGDYIYYSLVMGSNQMQLVKPLFVFVGFPFVELSVFYIILIATGFLAAIVPVLLSSRRNLISALKSE